MKKQTVQIIGFILLISCVLFVILSNTTFFKNSDEIKIELWEEKGEEANRFFYNDTYISGMHYRTFSYWKNEGGAAVINITKDSLEVILLLQQTKK